MLATIAVVLATVLAAISLVPQVVKLVRTKTPDGVSMTWAGFGVVTNLAWAAYLVSQQLWMAIPSIGLIVVPYAVTFVLLARLGGPARAATTRTAGWAAILTVTALAGGWVGLGAILSVSYAVQVAPGIWVAYRTPRPAGISATTWRITLVEGVLWGYYGWWHADTPLMVFAAVATAASIAMLARYAATRHRWMTPEPATATAH